MKEIWYLLYDGTSVDGRGEPKYVGRTKDIGKARSHYLSICKNPYSTGKVEIVTDKTKTLLTMFL